MKRDKGISRRVLSAGLLAVFVLAATPILAAEHQNVFDISQAFGDIPGVTPDSSPDAIANAIQVRLDEISRSRTGGRVIIPAGTWNISKPIFLWNENQDIVGAGAGKTILRAADGWQGMPMINLGARPHYDERPMQPCNRVRLTDPAARVLDSSVEGQKYGLRTYAEFPATDFPQKSHLAIGNNPADWKADADYAVNDAVKVNVPAAPGPMMLVCTREHKATPQNQPFRGTDWQNYWVAKLGFNLQCFADPLTAGAYDPATKRATNWKGTRAFTLDFAFSHNAGGGVYRNRRLLCGIAMYYAFRPDQRVWTLILNPDNSITFDFTLADGTPVSVPVARNCDNAGTYRLAVQIDFEQRQMQTWICRPGDDEFERTANDTRTLPPDASFQPLEYGYLLVTGGEGYPPNANGRNHPPTDITLCGLHTSAALRYDDSDELLARGRPTNDQFRYFTSDIGTLAFLPLTEPPQTPLRVQRILQSVEYGDASGYAGEKGYGYFKAAGGLMGVGRQRVLDMTIKPGPTWGVGIVTWNTLALKLWDLDIRGGYYAIGDLFFGAQYTLDVRNSILSGSEAAFNGMSNIIHFQNVTIDPVGRCGFLMNGSNCVLKNVRFVDPQTHRSEYYFRHLGSVPYGGMNTMINITAEAPAASRYPSKAAFSQDNIGGWRTSMMMDGVAVSNMGPNAAFLEFLPNGTPCHATARLEGCTYSGSEIAAFIRARSPWWSGEVVSFDPEMPVGKWFVAEHPDYPGWQTGRTYNWNNVVSMDDRIFLCRKQHQSTDDNAPGTDGRNEYWQEKMTRIYFEDVK